MKLYLVALIAVIGLFFIKGELGYLIVVVSCCYVIFDIIATYVEKTQQKMREEMQELARRLKINEEEETDAEKEIQDTDQQINEDSEDSEEAEEASEATSDDSEEKDSETPAEAQADSPEQSEDDSSTKSSKKETETKSDKQGSSELIPEELKKKYKGLEGKELEYAIAKDKVQNILSQFDTPKEDSSQNPPQGKTA